MPAFVRTYIHNTQSHEFPLMDFLQATRCFHVCTLTYVRYMHVLYRQSHEYIKTFTEILYQLWHVSASKQPSCE